MVFRKTSYTHREFQDGKHRFEHWYRDNSIYFITSKVRDGHHAFRAEEAKAIFWDRLDHWAVQLSFESWVVSLLSNHYHILGYLKHGENLGPFVQRLHGSVGKLVNDTLPARHLPFWRHRGNKDYFDGCIRDVLQATRAYRYTLMQAVRARLVSDYRRYPHTRIYVELDEALRQANERAAYLEDVPYARYDRRKERKSRTGQRRGRLSDHV